MTYTPGPWSIKSAVQRDNTGGLDYAILDGEGELIAETFEHVDYGTGTKFLARPARANALLIASAPAMRAFIESLTDAAGPYQYLDNTQVVCDARALLAKTGE